MLVLTSTVLLRSRWCVVMSVTSIDANCGHVGMRSPHGWVRSTIRTSQLLLGTRFVPRCNALFQSTRDRGEHNAERHHNDHRDEQMIGLEGVVVANDEIADAGDRGEE